MATTNLKARLILATKTAKEWSTYEAIPLKGELCVESDTKKAKLGNGTDAYAELTYTRFAKSLLATPTTRLCAYATTSRTAMKSASAMNQYRARLASSS